MTNRKTKLIAALKIAINALEKNTVFYVWDKPESCNCGIVAQAILDKTPEEIKRDFVLSQATVKDRIVHARKLRGGQIVDNWRELVQFSCSATGRPMDGIVADLMNAGMHPEDITHLEFMDNPAILNRTKIDLNATEKVKYKKKTDIPHPNIFKRMFGKKKTIEVDTTRTALYYESKTNLVNYLKAWVSILQEDPTNKDLSLQEQLLNAVADENYSKAAELRDLINESN